MYEYLIVLYFVSWIEEGHKDFYLKKRVIIFLGNKFYLFQRDRDILSCLNYIVKVDKLWNKCCIIFVVLGRVNSVVSLCLLTIVLPSIFRAWKRESKLSSIFKIWLEFVYVFISFDYYIVMISYLFGSAPLSY